MTIKIGMTVNVADKPGRWSVWSQAAGRGRWFLAPADDEARGLGVSHLTVRFKTDPETFRPVGLVV